MPTYAYDLEVYPNLFSATFIDAETNSTIMFLVHGKHDGREALREFMSKPNITLVGYNSLFYDNIILNFVLTDFKRKPQNQFLKELFNLSQTVINRGDIKKSLRYSTKYKSLDVMKIMALDKLGVSLKQIAVNLKHDKVQDLPLDWSKDVLDKNVVELLKYNKNDVLITLKLYRAISKQIDTRKNISELYGIDVSNCSDSGIANEVLNMIYAKETGIDKSVFKELKTIRESIEVKHCISDKVSFKSAKLQELLKYLQGLNLKKDLKFKFKTTVALQNIVFDIGVGGLHSRDLGGSFKSTEDYEIIDADVASFYPNIMLNEKVKPEHLDDKFLGILKMLTEERLAAKKQAKLNPSDTASKAKEAALKITINSIFGKLGFEYFWLYDPKAFMTVTINGQLFLLMLVERLLEAGIEVISGNTDGVVSKVLKSQKELYQNICKQWEADTKFALEFTSYKAYYRRDVNNYITLKDDGEVKEKGIFETGISLNKGYSYPIVAKALRAYFIEGISPEITVQSSKSIHDFFRSVKSKSDFEYRFSQVENSKVTEEVLQKTNRFYVATKGGKLIKHSKETKKQVGVEIDSLIVVCNDVDSKKPIEDYSIDYKFYIDAAQKIIDIIEPKILQGSLFG